MSGMYTFTRYYYHIYRLIQIVFEPIMHDLSLGSCVNTWKLSPYDML